MTKVISTINLKGGVGKTQITVALAEFLSLEYNKRVLLIDLDPQTNATVSLIDENVWLTKHQRGETILQLFKDKLDSTSQFNINQAIIKRVSNVGGGIQNLHLLPSSLGLIEIQDSLSLIPAKQFFFTNPVTILKETIKDVLNEYDFVLIDCPPNLGIITLNGIYISDYYIIPTIPDILSTYGIPQILGRIENFKQETKVNITPLGIIISMYRKQSRLHDTIIKDLRSKASIKEYPRIFNTLIPLTVKIAEAADFSAEVNTLKQKYGSREVFEIYNNLTKELLNYV